MADLRHLVSINAPYDRVYAAITQEAGVARWWTNRLSLPEGEEQVAQFQFGENFIHKIKVLDLQVNKRVEWLVEGGHPEWIGTRVVFRIEAKESQTILRFSHLSWLEVTDYFASCNYQWAYYLRSLKQLCETGEGMPYIN